MSIKAFRSGETVKYWSADPYGETIDFNYEKKIILLSCKMPSKGGGVTDVEFRLGSSVFSEIAAYMIRVNTTETINAFSSALENDFVRRQRGGHLIFSSKLKLKKEHFDRLASAMSSANPTLAIDTFYNIIDPEQND